MELILVAISLASLVCNVALVRRFLQTRVATLEVKEDPLIPIIDEIRAWLDAAEKAPEPTPAVPVVPNGSPWVNRSDIQQGVNAAIPAPPIQPIPRAPLARPDGFV